MAGDGDDDDDDDDDDDEAHNGKTRAWPWWERLYKEILMSSGHDTSRVATPPKQMHGGT